MRIFHIITIWSIMVSLSFAGMLAPGIGLRGTYYSKPDMSGTRVVKYDTAINMAWKEDAGPITDFKPGAFSILWRGYLLPAFSETYTFTATATGGVRLIVNNKRVFDDWSAKDTPIRTGTVDLKADKLVYIVFQTTQPAGAGSVQLQWSSPSLPIENIPAVRMYPPVFAPDQFVYCDNPDIRTSAIYSTNLMDTPKKLTVEGSYKPVFSPDGKKILFQTFKNLSYSNPGIYRLTFSTMEQIRLTKPEGDKYDPAFSADGRTIAFVTQIGTVYEIYTMRSDGGGRTKIVSDNYENRHPVANADGSVIIYQSKRDGVWNLYSVTISDDGNTEKQLTTLEGTEPTINRRGDKIVFISSRSGRPQLYSMGIDGANQTIIPTPGIVSQPFFTPNIEFMAYLEKNAAGKTDMFAMDLDDRIPCQVTANGKLVSAAISYSQQLPITDGLVIWLNAQDASSLGIDETGRITSWTDSYRNVLTATQPNIGECPYYKADGINGNPTVYFDNNRLYLPDLSPGWTKNEGTFIVLYSPVSADSYTIIHQNNGGGSEHWRYNGNGDGYVGLFMPNRHENYPSQMPNNGPTTLTLISGDKYTAYINGNAQPPRDPNFLAPTTMTLGSGGDSAPIRGHIAEIVIYNRALSDAERLIVEQYFKSLYGM
ncbi:MAG: PA14 domain-containing protein [bacterium]